MEKNINDNRPDQQIILLSLIPTETNWWSDLLHLQFRWSSSYDLRMHVTWDQQDCLGVLNYKKNIFVFKNHENMHIQILQTNYKCGVLLPGFKFPISSSGYFSWLFCEFSLWCGHNCNEKYHLFVSLEKSVITLSFESSGANDDHSSNYSINRVLLISFKGSSKNLKMEWNWPNQCVRMMKKWAKRSWVGWFDLSLSSVN